MAPLLHVAPGLPEGVLGDLVQLFPAQTQVVALVGAQHLLQDVLVVRGVSVGLGAVDETLDLTGRAKIKDVFHGSRAAVRRTVLKQSAHLLVEFRVASPRIFDPLLDNSAC